MCNATTDRKKIERGTSEPIKNEYRETHKDQRKPISSPLGRKIFSLSTDISEMDSSGEKNVSVEHDQRNRVSCERHGSNFSLLAIHKIPRNLIRNYRLRHFLSSFYLFAFFFRSLMRTITRRLFCTSIEILYSVYAGNEPPLYLISFLLCYSPRSA